MVLVSDLRNLCLPFKTTMIFSLFLLEVLQLFRIHTKVYNSFWAHFLYMLWNMVWFSFWRTYGYQIVLGPFVKKTKYYSFYMEFTLHFVEDQRTVYMWVYLWTLFCFIYLLICLTIWHCLNYRIFKTTSGSLSCSLSSITLFFINVVLTILVPCLFYMNEKCQGHAD